MSIQIKFFGLLADAVGKSQIDVTSFIDTNSLKQNLLNDFPKLKLYQFVIAVDKKIINHNQLLNNSSVVALLPPFAGG